MGKWHTSLACFPLPLLALAGIIPLALLGCGSSVSGPTRYQVTGTVTFEDKAVPAGWIIFEPDAGKGNEGPGGIAQIKNGRYVTDRGKGVVGGSYVVRVVGRTGVPVEQDGVVEPMGSRLFPEYKLELEFPEADSTQDLVVPTE